MRRRSLTLVIQGPLGTCLSQSPQKTLPWARKGCEGRTTFPCNRTSSPSLLTRHRAWLTTKGPVSQDDVSVSGLGEGGIF